MSSYITQDGNSCWSGLVFGSVEYMHFLSCLSSVVLTPTNHKFLLHIKFSFFTELCVEIVSWAIFQQSPRNSMHSSGRGLEKNELT